ncbi:low affinity immunoglobulin gamma Fc region receptor III-like [Notolabrus celidotus]|uniref:low affinity immunoglobulin gamma Fc region receptor III-like n=1 Tax=Notolabrus celidotus TaxID=1203425 RepID=UPI0014905B87|nr:low affinity immunoglobulin gamma Fc region receptor III-like [Notolabrus celidotus]
MEVTSLCIELMLLTLLNTYSAQTNDDAFPHIEPNRLQFFEYKSIQLDCKRFTGSTEWRVMGNTSSSGASRWEDSTTSKNIKPTFVRQSGEYWCQNGEGERSRSLNISIVQGNVILESPVLPVMEGQTVTLRCRKKTPPHDLTADFYKDGHPIGSRFKGTMTIDNVSKSDEGLYNCMIPGHGKSPNSRLAVRERYNSSTEEIQESTETPGSPRLYNLLLTVFIIETVAVLLLVIGLLYYGERSVSGERGDDVMSMVTYSALTEDLKKKGQ